MEPRRPEAPSCGSVVETASAASLASETEVKVTSGSVELILRRVGDSVTRGCPGSGIPSLWGSLAARFTVREIDLQQM